MADFTVRVELHGAGPDEYERLHQAMAERGFQRFPTGGDGKRWRLPSAEYFFDGSALSSDQVRDLAKQVGDSVRMGAWVLVTKSDGRSWWAQRIG